MACGSLLAHILGAHVYPQIDSKVQKFVCRWEGCKVYEVECVSSNWLLRHVQDHSEAKGKPYSCVFSGCCQRYPSPSLLQRHIDRDHSQLKSSQISPRKSLQQARSQNSRKFVDALRNKKRNICKSNKNIRKCPGNFYFA